MSAIQRDVILKRQGKIAAEMKSAELDAMILNPGPSLVYMTGLHFHLTERPVVCIFRLEGPPVIVLPELEAPKVDGLPYEIEVYTYSEEVEKWPKVFKKAARSAGLDEARAGVEDRSMRMLEHRLLKKGARKTKFVNAEDVVANLRMYKDAQEVAAMQAAVDAAQAALEATMPLMKIGMTEKEVAAELVLQLFNSGSGTVLPFQPIVSTGPNGANPHAFPSARELAAGDLLVIDWGASVDGYFSDITRTFAVGEPNAEQVRIHETVRAANRAARNIAKPGMSCGDVDKAARDVIEEAGYGQYFIHRTGHGLGMEGHEEPYMRANNPMLLEPGMTFTIEPGIYVPQQDGVRIEDDVVVTEDGLRSLTDMDRNLRVVGE